MRRAGQRSRRYERRERERREKKAMLALGRKAKREHERQKRGEVLTQAGRLSLVYAFRYALKQGVVGLGNVHKVIKPHLAEFRTEVLERMVMDIEVHWAATVHKMERHCLAGREQEDFCAMLVREIERRKRDGAGSGNGNA